MKQHSFWSPSKWVVCSLLLWILRASLSQPTYTWTNRHTQERHVCRQCPPGTYVAQHCSRERQTACKPCPGQHYTQYWNYLERCLYCSVFCNRMEEEASACNGTHNRVCQCKAGFHAEQDFCIKHSPCPLGAGVVQLGNPHGDTKCVLCAPGTFSSSVSSTDSCQPHRNCSEQGLEVNVHGTRFHDTLCTACQLGKAGSEEGLENADCQEALIDFVPYEIKSRRRLLHLKQILSNEPRSARGARKNPEELQVELHNFLLQLKNANGRAYVVRKLQETLTRLNLHHIKAKINKHFERL
ncbi:tumor necrosis factor receptor superfamily member 6B [Varanus komodoensis]|uniref:TNF receptor superfamily member 6b n=1 Tax=Varanus komodoensis TaxID=61221 RepID=A0A8D2IYI7_VARKO|nr:tumor necrosis factor receptor superfamily member 6B [Varanus komodoensis]